MLGRKADMEDSARGTRPMGPCQSSWILNRKNSICVIIVGFRHAGVLKSEPKRSLVLQNPTSKTLPTQVRDLINVRWPSLLALWLQASFGLKTSLDSPFRMIRFLFHHCIAIVREQHRQRYGR